MLSMILAKNENFQKELQENYERIAPTGKAVSEHEAVEREREEILHDFREFQYP